MNKKRKSKLFLVMFFAAAGIAGLWEEILPDHQ